MNVKEIDEVKREIIVLTNGWVFVGTFVGRNTEYSYYENVQNIRVWGTTAGLGQLALRGKTKDTVLDECGLLKTTPSQVLFTIPVTSDL